MLVTEARGVRAEAYDLALATITDPCLRDHYLAVAQDAELRARSGAPGGEPVRQLSAYEAIDARCAAGLGGAGLEVGHPALEEAALLAQWQTWQRAVRQRKG